MLHLDYTSAFLQVTHVSIVDVEHVNLRWRFNFLDTSSVPTERKRDRRKRQFHSLIRGEKSCSTGQFHVFCALCYFFFMEMTERCHTGHLRYQYWGVSDLQFHLIENIHFHKKQNTSFVPLTVQYRQIFYGSEERADLVFITSRSESVRSLSYS